jgi:hypothetical protein
LWPTTAPDGPTVWAGPATVDPVSDNGRPEFGPLDPFLGDPNDPAAALEDEDVEPLGAEEHADVLSDIEDLEVFEALLGPRGIKGVVVDCDDCREPHFFAWDLMRANLRHLLTVGQTRVHEPAFNPDPGDYVSWDYARGYADGVMTTVDDERR